MVLPIPFDGFAAHLPDDAVGPVPAIELRVGAGRALLQTFLAIPVFEFVADHGSVPIRMKSAFHTLATALTNPIIYLQPVLSVFVAGPEPLETVPFACGAGKVRPQTRS